MLIPYPHPILSVAAFPVARWDHGLAGQVESMHLLLRDLGLIGARGVALAAPQAGIPLRMFVWHDDAGEHVAINPEVVERSGAQYHDEGCLSLLGPYDQTKNAWRAGLEVQVRRSQRVVMRAKDADGSDYEVEATDFLARVIEHEVDHLDGMTILDRVSRPVREQALKRWERSATPDRDVVLSGGRLVTR